MTSIEFDSAIINFDESGLNAIARTFLIRGGSEISSVPVIVSQRRITWSSPTVTIRSPEREALTCLKGRLPECRQWSGINVPFTASAT